MNPPAERRSSTLPWILAVISAIITTVSITVVVIGRTPTSRKATATVPPTDEAETWRRINDCRSQSSRPRRRHPYRQRDLDLAFVLNTTTVLDATITRSATIFPPYFWKQPRARGPPPGGDRICDVGRGAIPLVDEVGPPVVSDAAPLVLERFTKPIYQDLGAYSATSTRCASAYRGDEEMTAAVQTYFDRYLTAVEEIKRAANRLPSELTGDQ